MTQKVFWLWLCLEAQRVRVAVFTMATVSLGALTFSETLFEQMLANVCDEAGSVPYNRVRSVIWRVYIWGWRECNCTLQNTLGPAP